MRNQIEGTPLKDLVCCKRQGQRYELLSILALVLIGYMQGYTSLARIYRFGKTLTKTQKKQLGFISGSTPSHPTITETMKRIDVEEFQQAISSMIRILMWLYYSGQYVKSKYIYE